MSHNFHRTVLVALWAIFGTALAMVPWTQRAQAQTGPSLVTDHTGYKAGETVTISGSGFAPNESVNFQVIHANGRHEPSGGHDRVSLLADGTGAFTATWSINALDLEGNSFDATAAGRVSGDAPPAEFRRIATVETDRYDYKPGDTVLIRGAGFLPNEQVTLQVLHLSGRLNGSSYSPFNTYADSTGHIASTWLVSEADRDSILTLTATGSYSGLKALTIFTDLLVSIPDDGGVDDVNSNQVDVSKLTEDDQNFPNSIATTWQWDDTGWSGNNSGNICGLFDIDHDQLGNFAVCVAVKNDPADWFQTSVYSCSDKDALNCTNPALIQSWTQTKPPGPATGPCTATVVSGADPFDPTPGHGNGNVCNGTNCTTADTVAACTIPRVVNNVDLWNGTDFGPFLINVCSEPSNEPNSNPFDCVIVPTQGFLKIIKNDKEPNDSTLFTFTTNPPSGHDGNTFQVNGSGAAHSTLTNQTVISFAPQNGTLTVTESIPGGWVIDSQLTGCVITDANNVNTPTGGPVSTSTGAISNISIVTGLTTTCTFANQKLPGTLTVVKVVTNDNGGTKTFTDFQFDVAGPTSSSNTVFEADGTNELTVNAGTYTVTEDAVSGYTTTYSADCTAVVIPPGGSKTCTITNNDVAPQLTLVKVVTNDNGGNAQPNDFLLTVGGTGVQSGAKNAYAANTPLAINETVLPGYAFVSITGHAKCPAALGGTVTLDVGEDITCTITNNDVAPQLTLVKMVTNDNGGNAQPNDFLLTVGGNGVQSGAKNAYAANTPLAINETVLPGYAFVSITGHAKCPQALAGTVTLDEGDDITCTITNNDIAPQLTLVKVVTNDNGGNAQPNDFLLTVGGTGVQSGAKNAYAANTPLAINETVLPGYAFVSITGHAKCPAALAGTVTLDEGDDITCTITNNDQAASLTLVKVVTNDNGGNALPNDFLLTVGGNGVQSGAKNAYAANTPLAINETVLPGYAFVSITGHAKCPQALAGTVTLDEGDDITCTITNNDIAPKLTLVKVVTNDNGGNAQPNDFLLTVGGTGVQSGVANSYSSNTPLAINETLLTGYTFDSITGHAKCPAALAGTVTLDEGDDITCTITNNDVQPTLTLIKTVTNDNGGTKTVSDFPLFVDGSPVTSGAQNSINAGAHTASETTLTGYAASVWGGDCAEDGTITLAPGDAKTCTITNNDEPATLHVVKVVTNDNGGTKAFTDFLFDVAGPTASNNTVFEADGTNDLTVNAGTYTVTEDAASEYATTYSNCTNVVIPSGGSATCTITNNDRAPSLTLNKIVLNNNGGTATANLWTLNADGTGQDPTNLSGPGPTVSSGSNFMADTYNLSETGSVLWYTNGTAWNCVKNQQPLNGVTSIQLAVGDTATCAITNDDVAPRLTLVKTVTNASGGTATAANWTLRATGPISISGISGSAAVTNAAVSAGNYTLGETGPPGYTASLYSCVVNGGTPVSSNSLSLALGDTATCTINNRDNPAEMPLTKMINGHTMVDCGIPVNGMVTCHQDTASGPLVTVNQYTITLYDNTSGAFATNYPNSPFILPSPPFPVPGVAASLVIPPDFAIQAPLNHSFTLCEMGTAIAPFATPPLAPFGGNFLGGGLPPEWVAIWNVVIKDANGNTITGQSQFSGPFDPDVVVLGQPTQRRSCINFTLPTAASGGTIAITINNVQMGHIIVDKVTDPSGNPTVFDFQATGTGYIDFQLADATPPNNQTLIPGSYGVREVLPLGDWKVANLVCVNSVGTVSTFRIVGSGGQPNSIFDIGDDRVQIDLAPAETITCTFTNTLQTAGRMTGGGSIFNGDSRTSPRVTHGFELHCDPSVLPNNLEINWPSTDGRRQNQFHLEMLNTAVCTDNPSIVPKPPKATTLDTYTGTGTGRYNGTSGYQAQWVFTDAGEPGTSDAAWIKITDPSGITTVLEVFGNLSRGNQQMHQ